MKSVFDDDEATFRVVINDELQYSMWPVYMDIPDGWTDVGKIGSKQECVTYIDEVWTDLRPASLRRKMAADSE